MWESLNDVLAEVQTYALREAESMTDEIYALVNYDDICVVMMDTGAKSPELADEVPFSNESPLYFSESSHRVSPVFRLYSVCDALRQHPGLCCSNISGVLLTTSNIINEEDMQDIWKSMNITVRCVKKMQHKVSISPDRALWRSVSTYLREKIVEDSVDLNEYRDMIEDIALAEEFPIPTYEKNADWHKR